MKQSWLQISTIVSFIGTIFCVLSPVQAVELPGEVSFRTDSFVSPDYGATADKSFSFIGAKFKNLNKVEGETQVEISGIFSPAAPILSYLNVAQFYTQNNGLIFGRKKQNWSLLDEQWHLGFFQPQFRWNPLTPETQGLTGFFYDLNNEDKNLPIGMRFFASFLFLPDQGPNFQIKNGQFESINPWFPNLPTAVQIDTAGQVVNRINWELQKPEVSDVVYNSSYAGQLYLGNEDKGLYLSSSLAYMPSNQFMMGVDLNVPPNATINVLVRPTIYYHTVASLDGRYSFENMYFGVSALDERPKTPDLQTNLTYRIFGETEMISPYIGFKFRSLNLQLSYLSVQQGSDQFVGPRASNQLVSVLPVRLEFKDASRVDFAMFIPIARNQNIKIKTTYLQGVADDFALWTSGLDYQIDRQWKTTASMIFVRADSHALTAPLFQQYANNDAITIGASYVF